tara:strand:- start:9132 stop:9707 length:576 start_codon:yes stop_codon:yes gene_type:complete
MHEDRLLEFINSGNINGVYSLIMNGVDINYDYGAPLRRSIETGNFEIMKLLILNGADPMVNKNRYPIHEFNALYIAENIDNELDIVNEDNFYNHPYIQYLLNNNIDEQYRLTDFIYDLEEQHLNYAVKKLQKRIKKLTKRKKGLSIVLGPSQKKSTPVFHNPAQAVFSQEGLMKEILHHTGKQWGTGRRNK